MAGADDGAFVESPVTVAASTKVRAAPASYDDHFSQARLFWASMTPVEKEHIIRAYTFELGKCYEQAIKERQLQALANIDEVLCAEVAAGLGLPAPEPTVEPIESEPSPALSQLGRTWPADGRMVGLVVDPEGDLGALSGVRGALLSADVLPLVIGPTGGVLPDGTAVQRTFLTGRSVELDAVVLLGRPAPAADALPARDSKAGDDLATSLDPRVGLMLEEAFRHCKVLGGLGAGRDALAEAGYTDEWAGVLVGDDADEFVDSLLQLMSHHRAWERFATRVTG